MAQAHDQIVVPLENFRKDRIGGVKEHKKKFDKKTAKFCQAQERFLNMSSKKPDNTIQEVSYNNINSIETNIFQVLNELQNSPLQNIH